MARVSDRLAFIETYAFPPALADKLRAEYEPELSDEQIALVLKALRQWFAACLYADGALLGMPSNAVDAAWHEFILMTREYHAFCDGAYGRYLHHSPQPTPDGQLAFALQRTLAVVHKRSLGLASATPGVPLLFAVDGELGIDDSWIWTRDDIDRLRRGARDGAGLAGCGGGGCGGG